MYKIIYPIVEPVEVKTKDEIIANLVAAYNNDNRGMYEVLEEVKIEGLSVRETVGIYARCIDGIYEDKIYILNPEDEAVTQEVIDYLETVPRVEG